MARLTLTPQPDPCPRCGALTIICLDAPVAALPVRLDPVPLDLAGELAARLEGRATYMLTGHWTLRVVQRDTTNMHVQRWPVLATHTCPGPVPATALPPPHVNDTDDDPPF